MIKTALLSVSDKSHLAEFAKRLAAKGIKLLSTGGTANALREAGLDVVDVSDHTGFPEMLGGRVKTLHPKVHGGLLGKRDDETHQKMMDEHGIDAIDLVVVNLYPFEQTVSGGGSYEQCVEQIDIGGPAMLRSAAKNHSHVTIVTDPDDYERVAVAIEAGGDTTAQLRKELAKKAYSRTAAYDAAISNWFAKQAGELFPERLVVSATRENILHYGENPHQQAAFYKTNDAAVSLANATQLQGNPLSYNNVNDTDAALACVSEFSEPAVVIVKHANPCGVAIGEDIVQAYARALACDSVSAYGGIIAVNRPVTKAFAEAIAKLFVEVLIAPGVDDDALPLLEKKKKLRLLSLANMPDANTERMTIKTVQGGFLVQQNDAVVMGEKPLEVVTGSQPTEAQLTDMQFAFAVAKHVKSNTIVLVKDGATVGIGAGQMSRIDSTNIAVNKAASMELSTQGAVLASDAFFPFPDNVELAAEHGIAAIIQPGGSIRDEEVIEAADTFGIAMAFTGIRHFRH